MRRGGPQRGVEGDVVGAAVGRPRLDVAPPLALGLRARAAAGALARQTVERGIQFARREFGLALDLLAAFPPVGVLLVEDVLRRRLGLAEVRQFLVTALAQGLTFFLAACSSSLSALASAASSPSLHSDMTWSS